MDLGSFCTNYYISAAWYGACGFDEAQVALIAAALNLFAL